jgi:hypothetical protein
MNENIPKHNGIYPDAKLLNREKKVEDRENKEKIRGGTKHLKDAINNERIDISNLLNTIICGSSELVLKDLPDNCIDIIITSPPYNFGMDYKEDENKDALFWQDYFDKSNMG